MVFRRYDSERDLAACLRIWREVGWVSGGDNDALFDELWSTERSYVAEQDEEAECLVNTATGSLRYLEAEMPFSAVNGVATGRVARGQGLATHLTAHAVSGEAEAGSLVCGLGCFEQGFYNRLGFGSGGYDHELVFDPAQLMIPERPRPPARLTGAEHRAQVRLARLSRRRGHGAVNLDNPQITNLGSGPSNKCFGLGYFDGPSSELTHYLWLGTDNAEHGPYSVYHYAWQTRAQFRELMGVLKGLADQVHAVGMYEPPGTQLQDLLRQPTKMLNITGGGKYECASRMFAAWQMRILDLHACLARTHLWGPAVRFNLALSDPIEPLLDESHTWRGVGGEYVVTLGGGLLRRVRHGGGAADAGGVRRGLYAHVAGSATGDGAGDYR